MAVNAKPVITPTYIEGGFVHWTVTLQRSEKRDDPIFSTIYKSIISDKAYELLQAGSEAVTDDNEMGNGTKFFLAEGSKGLKECGCEVLGRSPTNTRRSYFENTVINHIDQKKLQSIRITAFATGLLFSELVVLCKVINRLSQENKPIIFNCIDFKYDTLEENFEKNNESNVGTLSWKPEVVNAVNGLITAVERIINLAEVNFSSDIVLRFFKSAKDYIIHCESDTKYQYDILIGADRGNTDEIVKQLSKIKKAAPNIFLERHKDESGIDCAYLSINSKLTKL